MNLVKENNQLSQEQEQVVDDILGICHDILNALNNDDNNPDDSSRHNINNYINTHRNNKKNDLLQYKEFFNKILKKSRILNLI